MACVLWGTTRGVARTASDAGSSTLFLASHTWRRRQTFSRTEDSATFEIEGTNPADLDLCPNEPLPGTFFPAYLETKGTKCRATPSGTDSSDKDGSQCGSVQTIKRKYKICTAEKELTRKVNRDVPDFVATWTATKDKYCPTETIRPGTVS